MPAAPKPVVQVVAEYLGGHLVPPELVPNPETGEVMLVPARYDFEGPLAVELERLARASSASSGLVPTPEDLTGQAMAQIQASQSPESGEPPQEE